MILSDRTIRHEMETSGLIISPYDPELLQPASYDLTLSPLFVVQVGKEQYLDFDPTGRYIEPGEFMLVSTVETVSVGAHLAGQVEGKSSLARLGLQVHAAGFIDPGFEGQITLELFNMGATRIWLIPGQRIAQVKFMLLTEEAERPYGHPELGSHYQGQQGPTESRYGGC